MPQVEEVGPGVGAHEAGTAAASLFGRRACVDRHGAGFVVGVKGPDRRIVLVGNVRGVGVVFGIGGTCGIGSVAEVEGAGGLVEGFAVVEVLRAVDFGNGGVEGSMEELVGDEADSVEGRNVLVRQDDEAVGNEAQLVVGRLRAVVAVGAALFPEVAAVAGGELDQVVFGGRMPRC